jgi:hypothetical protein
MALENRPIYPTPIFLADAAKELRSYTAREGLESSVLLVDIP